MLRLNFRETGKVIGDLSILGVKTSYSVYYFDRNVLIKCMINLDWGMLLNEFLGLHFGIRMMGLIIPV